ncbi:hypothetical protein DK28_0207990 [Peptococcaceae bacterium SCADC1_2_3]|jgi:hypothetical protein|nr:hypothetical protein DK28_0207990 [Peptococcaceae bacterium SCADC1_2_3]KFI36263.1 hypothetical protein HY00_04155 [Peptococcaceae bacterium SCADC1_2_3]HBQ28715.1 DUF366 domain-containing protein [Desulfotomaculum sp.]HCJ79134.1 DUF366 domain-containing protein [Desulfotomaculum sp.]
MYTYFFPERLLYDGIQLTSLWALRNFRLQGDSIVSFRGPCRVDCPALVDVKDVLDQAPIFSEDMLHFIVEHFELDLTKTILRQRILISLIKEILETKGSLNFNRRGDDLFIGEKKLSVSIATLTPVSTMIHTGLNATSENTPVATVGLLEVGWTEKELPVLAELICQSYAREMQEVQQARCKVRGVG